MKDILIVALIVTSIITASCNTNNGNNTKTDSASTEDMTRKFGNNSGMPDSSTGQEDSAVNRSDTPRMSN